MIKRIIDDACNELQPHLTDSSQNLEHVLGWKLKWCIFWLKKHSFPIDVPGLKTGHVDHLLSYIYIEGLFIGLFF